MFFLILLTIGFVYEYGKGALYFTDHRSAISSPERKESLLLSDKTIETATVERP